MAVNPDPSSIGLSAAEALVLRSPQTESSPAALKLTLTELLARRAILISEVRRRGFLGRESATSYLRLAPDSIPPAAPPHVLATLQLVADAASGSPEGAAIAQVVERARATYGAGLAGFRARLIVPHLIARGLLAEQQARVLWVLPYTKLVHTTAGAIMRDRIEEQIARARHIPAMLDTDPTNAVALALGLGGALLLVEGLRPHYARLSSAMQQGGDPTSFHTMASDSSPTYDDQQHGLSGLDLGAFDGGAFDLGAFDLSAFDSLDTVLDSFDSGFDSSVDSGGDSGGGDSGSGDGGGGD